MPAARLFESDACEGEGMSDRTDPDRALVALMAAVIYGTGISEGGQPAWSLKDAVAEAHNLLHIVETMSHDPVKGEMFALSERTPKGEPTKP